MSNIQDQIYSNQRDSELALESSISNAVALLLLGIIMFYGDIVLIIAFIAIGLLLAIHIIEFYLRLALTRKLKRQLDSKENT